MSDDAHVKLAEAFEGLIREGERATGTDAFVRLKKRALSLGATSGGNLTFGPPPEVGFDTQQISRTGTYVAECMTARGIVRGSSKRGLAETEIHKLRQATSHLKNRT